MVKKPKKVKPDKPNEPATRVLIKRLLKEGKSNRYISAVLGFNSKVVQYVIDRYGLEENLIKPKLIGIE